MAEQQIHGPLFRPNHEKSTLLKGEVRSSIDQNNRDVANRPGGEPRVSLRKKAWQIEKVVNKREIIRRVHRNYELLYNKYANLFDFAPHGFIVIDQEGVVIEINLSASLTLNAPRSKLIGRNITDFIHLEDCGSFNQNKMNCLKGKDPTPFELRMKKTDGFFFDAKLLIQLNTSPSGDQTLYYVSLEDISEHAHLTSRIALQQASLDLALRASSQKALLEAFVQMIKGHLQCNAAGVTYQIGSGLVVSQIDDGYGSTLCTMTNHLKHKKSCMCNDVINNNIDYSLPFFTEEGSFYINSSSRFITDVSFKRIVQKSGVCNIEKFESIALVPLKIDGNIVGLLHVADHQQNKFPLRVVETLQHVCIRLGLGLKQLLLKKKLSESLNSLNDLSSHMLTVQEGEQRRIAMELHDGCGQDMNALKLRLRGIRERLPDNATGLIDECDQLLKYSDKIINDIRNIAHGLMPAELDALGLSVAVKQMVRDFEKYAKIQVKMDISALGKIKNPNAQICLFRIFQEALNNISKHSQAKQVIISALRKETALFIRIEDDGIGFKMKEQRVAKANSKRMGLSTMALRCRMFGAKLSIENKRDKGGILKIYMPNLDLLNLL